MEFMRIGGIFGPAISRFINKTVRNKIGVDPDIKIHEMSVTQNENRVEVTFKATMSEDELQALLMEVTK